MSWHLSVKALERRHDLKEAHMKREQYVCLVCGFNAIGFDPHYCPL
jgi:rubrerythrin